MKIVQTHYEDHRILDKIWTPIIFSLLPGLIQLHSKHIWTRRGLDNLLHTWTRLPFYFTQNMRLWVYTTTSSITTARRTDSLSAAHPITIQTTHSW
jgi:hypothetical protein